MEQKLLIYNTLTRTKERFTPLHAPNVGMYPGTGQCRSRSSRPYG